MSSREPLWFCHECHSEMRPLMVPDPACASCHGSFVEKMENPSDDPRHFSHDDEHGGEMPPGMDTFLLSLQSLMDRGINRSAGRPATGPAVTFELRGSHGARTVSLGGPNTLRRGSEGGSGGRNELPGPIPVMSSFVRAPPNNNDTERTAIQGPLMAQYLMAILGQRELPATMFGVPENGRMGDYVFNQEALDQIISQIMENSNAHRPVPATEEIIAKLPREVLMEGSATLEQDCAVCKEQFKLETDDPDEQVVITLPCKHPFHEPCILPWLKSSGTCPVCRHALVPQPEHHPTPPVNPGNDSDGAGGSRRRNPSPGSSPAHGPEPGGLFHAIFGGLSGSGGGNRNTDNSSGGGGGTNPWSTNNESRNAVRSPFPHQQSSPDRSQHRRTDSHIDSHPPSSSERGGPNNNVPGGWSEDLD
ncbi:hypothetical protein B0H34DRAFT_739978 [Crassisporium funariophilum]|nr:hypothetical protein B0H34DRAFT_739978 [Crassisporium funariophilum]